MAKYTLTQDDLGPSIQETLQDQTGATLDLSGASAEFVMRDERAVVVLTKTATVLTPGSSGTVRVDWSAGDLATSGTFRCAWRITFPGGLIETTDPFDVYVRPLAAALLGPHALTLPSRVRAFLVGKTDVPDDHEPTLGFLIDGVSEAVERVCSRHFERAAYTETKSVTGAAFYVAQRPVVSDPPDVPAPVVSVDGAAVTDFSWTPQGRFYRRNGWGDGRLSVPGTLSSVVSPDSYPNVSVTYTAGYVLPRDASAEAPQTLPRDLEMAVVELVAAEYQLRDKVGLSGETFEGMTLTFDRWPSAVLKVLDRHARKVVV